MRRKIFSFKVTTHHNSVLVIQKSVKNNVKPLGFLIIVDHLDFQEASRVNKTRNPEVASRWTVGSQALLLSASRRFIASDIDIPGFARRSSSTACGFTLATSIFKAFTSVVKS